MCKSRNAVLLIAVLIAICRLAPWAGAEPTAPISAASLSQSEPSAEGATEIGSESGEMITTLFLNSHEQRSVQAGEEVIFRFVPDSSDSYIFRIFPVGQSASAQLEMVLLRESDGQRIEPLRQEQNTYLAAQLQAGESYALHLTAAAQGEFAAEVMLEARGRCFDNPISLPADSIRYAKTIVRPRDVHWFSFTAPVSGWYSIRTEKTGGTMLDTLGFLLDGSGRMIAVSDNILFPGDPNFMIQQELTAGETYYVRISAFSNLTGAYRLAVTMPEEGQQIGTSVKLTQHDLMLDVDQSFKLTASVSPADALGEVVYVSSDSTVVSVEPDGTVSALRAGKATVWAMYYNGIFDQCTVTVRPVEVAGMAFSADEAELRVDEELSLSLSFTPINASDQRAKYTSSDESVVRVSADGVLTGVSKGSAVITAVSMDGGFTDTIKVRVQDVRPTYRALVIGEQDYADGVRVGGLNTAQGVADMLRAQVIDGSTYEVRLQLDSTRRELLDGIQQAFSEAKDTDISLFYINCHGAYENGVAYLRLHDETHITVGQLEQMLRTVSGKVVVILDFCQSGSFIGAGGDFEQFSANAQRVFSGGTALTSGKYTVITSASADQDSYRRSFARSDDEDSTAAIMGRSLCEGAGWDIIYDRSVSLKADQNRDKRVTVQEIYDYTRRRVAHYLEETGASQTVHLYPEGDQTVIFGKE